MDTSAMTQQIEEKFGVAVASDEKLVAECINMCKMFNLTPEDLSYKWEALSFNSTRTLNIFTMESAAALKTKIQRDLTADNAKKQPARARLAGSVVRGRAPVLKTGHPRAVTSSSGASATGVTVKEEMKMDGIAVLSSVDFKRPIVGTTLKSNRAYRYMHEKVTERSEALDDRISELAMLIREHYGIDELGDPATSTDDEITVVGRITLDAESSSTGSVKLNEASLCLESPRSFRGLRVAIRMVPQVKIRGGAKGAGGLGFFQGEIVALRGKNGSGADGYFLVNEILAMPPMKPSPGASNPSGFGKPFTMCICSGPYTSESDLKYTPWHVLLATLKTSKPNVVLLTGPFIDSAHPNIKNGDLDHSPNQLFRQMFTDNLRDFLSVSPGSIVLLVPSVRDIVSNHAVYPQCELGIELCGGDPRIHMLPNPCRFSINGVSFAVTSVDVIVHLKKEEFFKRGEEVDSVPDSSGPDIIAGSCRHLLQQRSFYPIFPVPFDLLDEVNLDISHSHFLNMDYDVGSDAAPDVLVVPSRLIHFSKVVQGTVSVNPSFVSKGLHASLSLLPGQGTLERLQVEIMTSDGNKR